MKAFSHSTLMLALAAAAVTSAGVPLTAHAVSVTTPASACQPFSQTSAAGLSALGANQSGMTNGDFQLSRNIICPVVRAADGNGVTVFVDGQAAEDAAIACTLYSHNFDGTLRASKGFVEKRAQFDRALSLSATEAPTFAYLNVVCSLPPKFRAKIFGVLTSD